MKIFVDESAWVSLIDPNAPYHEEVAKEFNKALNNGDRIFTHNIAVGNATAILRESLGISTAIQFNQTIEEAYAGTHLSIAWIGRRTQKEAFRLLRKHADLELDLYDLAAYLTMRRRRITTVVTIKTGYQSLGLRVIPEGVDL